MNTPLMGIWQRFVESRQRALAKLEQDREDLAAQRQAAKAANAVLAWCPNCQQNVCPVRKATASGLILTGGVGYALSAKDSCPMCRAKNLQPAHVEPTEPAPAP